MVNKNDKLIHHSLEPYFQCCWRKKRTRKGKYVRVPISDETTLDSEAKSAEVLPSKGPGTPEFTTVKSFQSLVGSLLWILRCSRPDISYEVHRATHSIQALTTKDMKIARSILRYLAGTAELKLLMGEGISEKSITYRAIQTQSTRPISRQEIGEWSINVG